MIQKLTKLLHGHLSQPNLVSSLRTSFYIVENNANHHLENLDRPFSYSNFDLSFRKR